MAVEQTKLEELMYLSLIGKFDYKHICDGTTYICYTSSNEEENKDEKVKPVYITSTNMASEKISLNRINAFEKKIFDENYVNLLESEKLNSSLNYNKRIKDFINVSYVNEDSKSQKNTVKNFKNNFINLLREEIVDKEQFEAAVEYVSKHFNKFKENIH